MALYLVTGSAGFIGFRLSQKLIQQGHQVVGFDNLNNYYSPELKNRRNDLLKSTGRYDFIKGELAQKNEVDAVFKKYAFDSVFHLAAQAGVRYSLENPHTYLSSNVDGTLNIFEAVRHSKNKPHILAASSSSVYGLSKDYPYREEDPTNQPVALYGVTKKSNELMGHAYSHLFELRITMLRFFTVYGPWGRPDMALFKFVDSILKEQEIEVYNSGDIVRDFTYVDDIVDGMLALNQARQSDRLSPYEVFNIGCGNPKQLMDFIHVIESTIGKKAKLKMLPFQPGDVHKTVADVTKLRKLTGYAPKTTVEKGIPEFVNWYREYYGV